MPGLPAVVLNPHLVLFVFPPPLLLQAASTTSLRDIRTYARRHPPGVRRDLGLERLRLDP